MIKNILLSAALLLFFSIHPIVSAQSSNQNQNEYLITIDSIKRVDDIQKAIKMGIPLIMKDEFSFAEFQYFGANGMPIYYLSHNLEAAKTISTNQLWTGGNLGLNLNGDSMLMGVWDGGKVRDTHVELVGRVTQIDATSTLSDHATHVSGTLIGGGIKAAAKGMAWKARLNAYDWNFDEIEMGQAASNGLLISNHSYGIISGWYNNKTENRWEWYGDTSISATEDWRYGFYNNQARDWDLIAVNNPFYLIVKSAGNDRGDKLPATETSHWVYNSSIGNWVESTSSRPADGPYDCIVGAGVSKNVLTVGAVNAIANGYSQTSDVVMSNFSGWGPTDDGRIKPDIVGNGVGVNSSTAAGDATYSSYNGTSMASPNIAGSLLLWQEHYQNLYNKNMRAATLKGLAIHTADEAGPAGGPDYTFGWGLVNSASAIRFLNGMGQFSELQESSLSNGNSYEIIVYNNGNEPLKASLSWTDPVANIGSIALNPTDLKLINDLDLRISRLNDNQEFQPWILDPANPSNAATKGDNFRDNIEQVFLSSPQAGFYKIKVTHKGNLASNNSQSFSLLVSGLTPKLQAQYSIPSQNICLNNPVQFIGSSLGDASNYEWTFFGSDTLFVSGASPFVNFTSKGFYSSKLKVSNQYTSDSLESLNNINVLESPSTTIYPLSGLFCSNDSTPKLLSGTSGTLFSGLGVSDSFYTPRNAGAGTSRIYGQLTDNNGCYGRDSFDLFVHPAPSPPIITEVQGDLVSSYPDDNTWYVHGQAIPGANQQKITPYESGLYYVEVDGAEGCKSRSAGTYFFRTSAQTSETNGFKLYPNPSKGQFSLEFASIESSIELKLFDLQGREIYKTEHTNTDFISFDASSLKSGVYLVKIRLSSGEQKSHLIELSY